jgi:hypothetical protein
MQKGMFPPKKRFKMTNTLCSKACYHFKGHLHFAAAYFTIQMGSCNLQQALEIFKKAPALCSKSFYNLKGHLHFAAAYLKIKIGSCSLQLAKKTFKNVPALCSGSFENSKSLLQIAFGSKNNSRGLCKVYGTVFIVRRSPATRLLRFPKSGF